MKQQENKNKQEQENTKNTEADSKKDMKSALQPMQRYFEQAIQEMTSCEKTFQQGLKKLQESVSTDEFKDFLEDHELQTSKHLSRLQKSAKILGITDTPKPCAVALAMVKEAEEVVSQTEEGCKNRDAILVHICQKMEHYEIACYDGLIQMAITLNQPKIADYLFQSLKDEESATETLTDIAEMHIEIKQESKELETA